MKVISSFRVIVVSMAFVASAHAELRVYDSFEQAKAGSLNGQDTGEGFANYYQDTASTISAVFDPSTRMTYSNGDITIDGGSTRMRVVQPSTLDANVWGRALNEFTEPEGEGPFYMSMLFRVSDSAAQPADEDSFLFGITLTPTYNPQFGINVAKHSSGTGNALGMVANVNNKLVTGCPALEGGKTYLVVFKWYKISGYYRGLNMIVDPSTAAEPPDADWTIRKDSGLNKPLSDYRAICFYLRNKCEAGDYFELDEFRIGTSWADVTGTPTYNGVVPSPSILIGGAEPNRTVTITPGVAGYSCYYTLDGSTPTAASGTLYTAPFALAGAATVKAVTVDASGRASAVVYAGSSSAHWTGAGDDDNWSTAANWEPQGSPANKMVTFGAQDRTVWGTVNNIIAEDLSICSLSFTNNNFAPAVVTADAESHVGTIPSGKRLKIMGFDNDGYSLLMTSPRGGWSKNSHVYASFGGGGAMEIDSPESTVYLSCNSSSAYTTTLLDLAGLSEVTMDVDTIYVGHLSRTIGKLYLSKDGVNTLTARVMTIGDCHGTHDAAAAASQLRLGQTNVINADLFAVGSSEKGFSNSNSGIVSFDSSLSQPTVKIRARDSVGRADVWVGGHGQGADVGMKATTVTGTLDFSLGSVDALIDELHVSRGCGRKYNGSNNGGAAAGYVTMSAGTMDVDDLYLIYTEYASKSDNPGCYLNTGSISVSGGSLVVNNDFDAANNRYNAKQGVTADVNLSGGTISVGGDMILASRHGQATNVIANVNVSGGTLSVAGDLIGGLDDRLYLAQYPAETVTHRADVNALGGVIAVTNVSGASELRLESGTLKLAGGKVFADNLVMTNTASTVALEIGADYRPAVVTAGGVIRLGGALSAAFDPGTPASGNRVIVRGGTRIGKFTSVDLPEGYAVHYTSTSAYISRGGLCVIIQ